MSELFDAVDALLASRAVLPPPEERRRLRQAHALTVDEVVAALKVRRATVTSWEFGKTEPRPPERGAYARLLDGLAKLYPAAGGPSLADPATTEPAPAPAEIAPVPETFTDSPAPAEVSAQKPTEAVAATAPEHPQISATPAPAPEPHPASTTRASSTSRRPGAKKAAPAGPPAGGADPRFANGPLAVVDVDDEGKVLAYCTG
ncbi:helix-turn-helix domain-containing protein, partial [Streptomyces sp. NPDC058664]|uniref:helix-turn-helix domain-containing protein n=1 Tax=unclassified Streptomyces TaxID=2593676 RepID=UPI00364ED892